MHFAVVEKITYNNVGTNGETEFHNILMAMMPDDNGTSISLEEGSVQSFNESTNLITTFIEEYDDLMIALWIQDNGTHAVLQSQTFDLDINVGITNPNAQQGLFSPNPCKGTCLIYAGINSQVQINDINGKQIINTLSVNETLPLDLSGLNNGIYFKDH